MRILSHNIWAVSYTHLDVYKRQRLYYALTTDNDRSLCKNYSENGEHDKGLWRAPNQREMMLMFIENKEFPNGTASRTKWRYTIPTGDNAGNLRFFSANNDGNPVSYTHLDVYKRQLL